MSCKSAWSALSPARRGRRRCFKDSIAIAARSAAAERRKPPRS